MSELFAWCRQVGDETVVEFDGGIVASRFNADVASQAGYTADALNAAVAAREKAAKVEALREAGADMRKRGVDLASKADSYPFRDARIGMYERANVYLTVADTLESRADQVEKGEA